MNTHKVSEIFIADGAASDADTVNIAAITGQFNLVSKDMTVASGAGITLSTDSALYAVNKLANGELKRSFPIKGLNVSAYTAKSYAPSAREVWAIGYNRKTAAGSIEVNNSTNYDFTIKFKWDKMFYSERQETLRVSFVSAAAATELTIATQIAAAINSSSFGSTASGIKCIQAKVVGDVATLAVVDGLSGATHYGVEIWALDVNQFANTSYKFRQVIFSTHVLDASGFGATTCTQIQAASAGNGTYEQVYNMENYNFQYEGVLNRVKFPIPTLAYLSSSAGYTSGAFTMTIAGTATADKITYSAASATQLPAGSKIIVGTEAHEIKYYVNAGGGNTIAILCAALAGTHTTGVAKGKAWYDLINILVDDVTTTSGANVGQFSKKAIMIASPAIIAGGTGNTVMTTISTGGAEIKATLDAWMATTPGAFPVISI